jgi:hypothetical protein
MEIFNVYAVCIYDSREIVKAFVNASMQFVYPTVMCIYSMNHKVLISPLIVCVEAIS